MNNNFEFSQKSIWLFVSILDLYSEAITESESSTISGIPDLDAADFIFDKFSEFFPKELYDQKEYTFTFGHVKKGKRFVMNISIETQDYDNE